MAGWPPGIGLFLSNTLDAIGAGTGSARREMSSLRDAFGADDKALSPFAS